MPRENSAHHKLFKVQPLLNHVVQNCGMELKQERDLSVDKATVKFKGHSRYETAHADEAGEIGNQSVGFNKSIWQLCSWPCSWPCRAQLRLSCCS